MSGLARVCSRKLDQAATDRRESWIEKEGEKRPREEERKEERQQEEGTAI
jgi:hypothetical protein